MRYLVDTHCLIWWLSEPKKLNKKTHQIFLGTSNELILSAVVSWEIAVKTSLGRLKLPKRAPLIFKELFEEEGFMPMSIEHLHTLKTLELPQHHADPFDRLLIAQALVENIPLITADKEFKKYPLDIVWAD